jgi:hypothetical protein
MMSGSWFPPPPIWISDMALLLVVIGLGWLGHALAWRLARPRRWQPYRGATRLAVIAIALLAMPALGRMLMIGPLPWAALALLALIVAGGWAVHSAWGRAAALATVVGLGGVAMAPAVEGLSHPLMACAGVAGLGLVFAVCRRIG